MICNPKSWVVELLFQKWGHVLPVSSIYSHSWFHPGLNAVWIPVTPTLISAVLSPEIQTHKSNCPLLTSSWMPNRHLKLTTFETSDPLPHPRICFIAAFPSSADGNVFLPGLRLKPHSHSWLLSFSHIVNPIYQEILWIFLQKIPNRFSPPPSHWPGIMIDTVESLGWLQLSPSIDPCSSTASFQICNQTDPCQQIMSLSTQSLRLISHYTGLQETDWWGGLTYLDRCLCLLR